MLEFSKTDFPEYFTEGCSHPGACDADVEYWLNEIGLALDPEDATRYLKGYGAWDAKELADHRANLARIIWLAAGQFAEGEEWAYFD